MKNKDKTKEQLVAELAELRQQIVELEAAETDRRQMEDSLWKEQIFIETALNAQDDIFFVFEIATKRPVHWNKYCVKLSGYSDEEIASLKVPNGFFEGEDINKALITIEHVLKEGSGKAELSLLCKDGKKIPIDFSASLINNSDGNPQHIVVVGRDITQRKHVEKSLQESEEKYHSLISFTEDFLYLVDRDCRYLFMNQGYRDRYGFDLDEFTKKTYADLHREDQVKDFSAGVAAVFETGKSIQNEVRSTMDGRYYLRTMSPVKGEGGKITAVTVVSKDITKRKQAEDELERHREHLRLINQILRHDIINDLAVVKSGLRLYKNSGDESLLDDITKKVDKSVELIREMKQLESFILSHKDLEFHNVSDIIKKVVENYGPIKFTIEGKCQVLADETFGSVIDNIIRNAINHGKTDRIDITIDKHENFCEVRIADHGVGIPDEIKKSIFEEGFCYGETGHTGLGLYIVKKAMESYGGSVHVEDNSPAGAVFVLKLIRMR